MLSAYELAVLLGRAENRGEALRAVAEHSTGSQIPDEVAPYVVSLSLEDMTSETSGTHLQLLRCVSARVLRASLPGLFSAYFRILRGSGACSALVKDTAAAMCTVLESVDVLDDHSQSRIFDFLYFYSPPPALEPVLMRLKRLLAPSLRVLVLRKLLLLGAPLSDAEYDALNESVDEEAEETPAVVKKLLERGKLVFKASLVDILARVEGSEEALRALQEQFLSDVPRPLIHLCPISERSMAQCHRADLPSMEKFFADYMREKSSVPVTAHVLLRYLAHPGMGSTCFLKAADLRRVDYSIVLDHVRRDIADVTSLRNLAAHAYCRQVCSLLPDVVDAAHQLGSRRMEYLEIIYLVVQRGDLDREELRLVFDELLYLDGDMRVRTAVLEILGDVVGQFGVLDDAVRVSAAEGGSGIISQADMARHSERISREDAGTVQTNNANVLAARLWPEIVAFRDTGMLHAVLGVLLNVVRGTKLFYSARMQSSGCLSDIVRCCSAGRGRTQSMCMELVELAAAHFQLTKRSFEEIFCAMEKVHDLPGAADVVEKLASQDRFFFFYLAARCRDAPLSARALRALMRAEDGDTRRGSAGRRLQ